MKIEFLLTVSYYNILRTQDNIVSAKQFRWIIEYNNQSIGFIDLYDYS